MDLWTHANLVTLVVTAISTTVCLFWLPANIRAGRTLADRPARWLAWVNVSIISVVVFINVQVFRLGLFEIQKARALDLETGPARVPDYVTQGTVEFMYIWLTACVAIIALSSVLSHIIAMPSSAGRLRVVEREERAG